MVHFSADTSSVNICRDSPCSKQLQSIGFDLVLIVTNNGRYGYWHGGIMTMGETVVGSIRKTSVPQSKPSLRFQQSLIKPSVPFSGTQLTDEIMHSHVVCAVISEPYLTLSVKPNTPLFALVDTGTQELCAALQIDFSKSPASC